MSRASSSPDSSATWSPVSLRTSERNVFPLADSRTALVAAASVASASSRRPSSANRAIATSARACADAERCPSANALSPSRTISFSRATMRRSRPGATSTTIMWTLLLPTSIAATRMVARIVVRGPRFGRTLESIGPPGAAPVVARRTQSLSGLYGRGSMGGLVRPARTAPLLIAALLVGSGLPARGALRSRAAAEDASEVGGACVVPVLLDDGDETLRKAYDGVRVGLEEANLPRACLRPPKTDDDAGWASLAAAIVSERRPFVVALGRRVGARLAATPLEG